MKKNDAGGERTGVLIVLETSFDTSAHTGTAGPGFSSRHTQAPPCPRSLDVPPSLSALGA
jgi:hypothetical protein